MSAIPQAPAQLCPTCSLKNFQDVTPDLGTQDTFKCRNCGTHHSVGWGTQELKIEISYMATLVFDSLSMSATLGATSVRNSLNTYLSTNYPGLYTVTAASPIIRVTSTTNTPFSFDVSWVNSNSTTGAKTLVSNGDSVAP